MADERGGAGAPGVQRTLVQAALAVGAGLALVVAIAALLGGREREDRAQRQIADLRAEVRDAHDAASAARTEVETLAARVLALDERHSLAAARWEAALREQAAVASAAAASRGQGTAGGAGAAPGGGSATGPAERDSPAAAAPATLDDDFKTVAEAGLGAFGHPKYRDLIARLREAGDEGRAFILRGLADADEDRRFAAAALAEGLKDPALIDPLERAAIDDESFMVRRMASHALAFMESPESAPALVRVVEGETRDAGVRLNAWYGLATLGRAEAFTLYERVLDQSGGDVPADYVAAYALKMSDPRMLPLLQRTYGKEQISPPVKAMIVRALAKEPGYRAFVEGVARDPAAAEVVRDAAEQALRENP